MRSFSMIAVAVLGLLSQPLRAEEPVGTFQILTEKGRKAKLIVLNYGLIISRTKKFVGDKGEDSANRALRDYRMTYDVVRTDQVPVKDGTVAGYEFKLPKIRRGDSIVVHFTTKRPQKLPDGSIERKDIDSPWTFDHRYSGATRTLFTEFRGPQSDQFDGEWELGLSVNDKTLVVEKFNFFFAPD